MLQECTLVCLLLLERFLYNKCLVNSLSQSLKRMSMCLLDRNCNETPAVCHQNATCTPLSSDLCANERPGTYCVCNQGYTGDGFDCQGKPTVRERNKKSVNHVEAFVRIAGRRRLINFTYTQCDTASQKILTF